jgi:predicted MFS family arabinose efflux permease
MLGLFLILPVISPYASNLSGATPLLIGLAVGAFPLTQTILQIPFGWLSDSIGRKPVIIAGLLLFAAGSLVAASAGTILVLILGFALQGAGAIGSVVVALLADLTRDSVRTRAMAMIGGAVGLALGVGFVGGPLIAHVWNVPALFILIAGLSFLAIPAVIFVVPTLDQSEFDDGSSLSLDQLVGVLKDHSLWRLHLGIFSANASLRALFMVVPFLLLQSASGISEWAIYLGVLTVSGLVMFPTIFVAERNNKIRPVLFGSIAVLALGLLVFIVASTSIYGLILGLSFYFLGFSLIEAILPSLVTRLAGENDRGTAMGVFSMSQYLGAFVGSLYGGQFLRMTESGTLTYGIPWMFGGLILLIGLWALLLTRLKPSRITFAR